MYLIEMVVFLLKYIENHLLDEQLFFHTRDLHGKNRFAVLWRKKHGRQTWVVENLETHESLHLKSYDFLSFLSLNKIDHAHIEACLREAIVNQVVLARQITSEAETIFGRPQLNEYVEQTENFYSELIENLQNQIQTNDEVKSEESIHSQDTDLMRSLHKPRPPLRLLKN